MAKMLLTCVAISMQSVVVRQTDRQADRMSVANTAHACHASSHRKHLGLTGSFRDFCCVVSGTLVSYLLLRELRRRDGPMHINWLIVVVHRYLRYVISVIFSPKYL